MTTGAELGRLAWEWWGSKGLPVFPCKADKRPLTPRGFKDAETGQAEIIALFAAYGTSAVYIGGAMGGDSGLFAIDLDLYREDAKYYKQLLESSNHLPPTRVHRTPKGGEHWIYYVPEGMEEVKSSKPHKGVDVKGTGGYVILPPSEGYVVISDKTKEAPENLIRRLIRADAAFKELSEEALEAAILSGEDFHNAIAMLTSKWSGQGRDLVDVQKRIMELLHASVASEPSHDRNSRWSELMKDKGKEVSRAASSAYKKFNPNRGEKMLRDATFPGGPIAPQSATPDDTEAGASDDKGQAETETQDFPFSKSYAAIDVDLQDNKNFLIYPLIMESDVLVLSAAPKAGKTLVSLTMALHMAAGLDFSGTLVPLNAEGKKAKIPVVYFALEGQGIIRKRVRAWIQAINADRGRSGAKTLSMSDLHLYIVERPVNLTDMKVKQDTADKMALVNIHFKSKGWGKVGLIVFDTLTKTMPGKDQNSVDDTSAVFEIVTMFREVGVEAAVMFVHHTKKDGTQPRGSSNIMAEPDTILNIEKLPEAVSKGKYIKLVKMSVYMARAIDDTQEYTFQINGVNIGENTQGIEEIAPVIELFDASAGVKSIEEDTLQKHHEAARMAFDEYVINALTTRGSMPLEKFDHMLRTVSHSEVQRFYRDLVPMGDRASVLEAWATLVKEIIGEGVTLELEEINSTQTISLKMDFYSDEASSRIKKITT